jgi:cytoskeleton protein RodZ
MTEELSLSPPTSTTAGGLLRKYREAQDLQLEVLAQVLRVSAAKLEALEADRWDDLPDAMFARALALAVCRQLKMDAAPVLQLLPAQDVSRLAAINERGLDFPLERPSFLPQSSFLVVARMFTPMRWAAIAVLVLALMIGFWPEIHSMLVFKDESETGMVVTPVTPVIVLPSAPPPEVAPEKAPGQTVVTTVHSPAVAAQAAQSASAALVPASSSGVPHVK